MKNLDVLIHQIIHCNRCPRLATYCKAIAREKRRAFINQTYWGKPVPGFGDPKAELLIVGLAPAAHGANRTGRMFTGDRSGEWLYRALCKAGYANQTTSVSRADDLKLKGAYVTAVVRCAPPDNKPLSIESSNCASYLEEELRLLKDVRVIIALGQIALLGAWPHLRQSGRRPSFAHGTSLVLKDGRLLLLSYHPSQQNTFTKRLTEPMFDSVFEKARTHLRSGPTLKESQ